MIRIVSALCIILLAFGGPAAHASVLPVQEGDGVSSVKSPEQVDWESRVSPGNRGNPAFDYVEENPDLPRILLIGDSISIGYAESVRNALKGKANVIHIPENGGSTWHALDNITHWLGEKKWDVIHFNWGLHDIKFDDDEAADPAERYLTSPSEYSENLEKLVLELKEMGETLIWATTTPVPEGTRRRDQGAEVLFNEVAAHIMTEHEILINDLHSHVLPRLEGVQKSRNVHFLDRGYEVLGEKVGREIHEALDSLGRPDLVLPD